MSVSILTGHLGSGKTEIAINLALQMACESKPVALIDIDVVNPYFTAREARQILEEHGVQLAAPSQKTISADIPALPKEIFQSLHTNGTCLILDVGGDPSGARILRGLRRHLDKKVCSAFCVVNTKRPSTSSREGILSILKQIREASGREMSAFIHNTHLLHETERSGCLRRTGPAGRRFTRMWTSEPYGRQPQGQGYPLRMSEILATIQGSAYIARVSVHTIARLNAAKRSIKKAFQMQIDAKGFSMVEVLSTCPTNWGVSPVEALHWLDHNMIPVNPLGVYKDIEGGA